MNVAAYIVAVVVFLLAALGVHVGNVTTLDLACFGSAAFALAHILPPR